MPRTGRPRTIRIPEDELRHLVSSGHRSLPIAKRYGCSAQTVLNRMKELGIPAHPVGSCPGEMNPAWKGGRYYDADGYVLSYAPDHPNATKSGRVPEHRLVMERVLGRYLLCTEVVDHIDGVRDHNDPSNLRVFQTNADHLRETLKGRVPQWSEDGLRRIREANLRVKDRGTVSIPFPTRTHDVP